MSVSRALVGAAAVILLTSTVAEARPTSSGSSSRTDRSSSNATQTSTRRTRYRSFLSRMYALRSKYRGHVHIARMNNKPAIFINTDFGQGDHYSWTTAQKGKLKSFEKDLQKALGTNTLQMWNPVGDDWLRVGTGTGSNRRLSTQNKGKTFQIYSYMTDRAFEVPKPGTERTSVMVKLKNPQLSKFNTYINAIRSDFEGTLGETEYNGGTPPYVSGRSSGSHNCTSWMTSWLKKEVGGGLRYGADPPSWCRWTARGDAAPVRGVLVFNHPNAPHTGQTVPQSFPLKFE